MAVFELRRNARVLINGEVYRLLKRVEHDVWQLECERTGRLAEYPWTTLLEMLRCGTLTYAEAGQRTAAAPPDPITSPAEQRAASRSVWDTTPEALRIEARRRLEYVKRTIDLPRSKRQLRRALADVPLMPGAKPTPSLSALARWTSAYIRGGRDIVALLPRYKDRGNRRRRFPERVIQLTEESIDTVYMAPERPTVKATLDDAIRQVARENDKRRDRGEDGILPLPSRRLVESLIARRDPVDVCTARYGSEYARHKYRQVLKGLRVTEALRRVEVDHTLVNLIVIDDSTFLPLGRPWLSAAIDTGTRCFMGYALSFEPPSYLSVMRCLKHAIMPKTYLASRYAQLRHDWPCHGIFDSLGLDNGKDFHSKALEDFAARYGIDLDYCPVRQPWLKGTIERALGTLNRGVSSGHPGTTFEDLIERGDYKSASRSCITLEMLHERIHEWIVDVYHQQVHRTLGMSPVQAWRNQMQHREIPLPTSAAELDQSLAVPMRRTLTHKGIALDHLFYNSPACLNLLARSGGSVEVDIGRPADDVGHVYVVDPKDTHHIRVPVIARYKEYATGLTPWQHTQCVRYAKTHYGGRDDVVALAEAKGRIRDGFIHALGHVRAAARKAAGRFLNGGTPHSTCVPPDVAQPTIPPSQAPNGGTAASASPLHPSAPIVARALTAVFRTRYRR